MWEYFRDIFEKWFINVHFNTSFWKMRIIYKFSTTNVRWKYNFYNFFVLSISLDSYGFMSWHHVLDTKERNTADHIMERWTTLKQWLQVDGRITVKYENICDSITINNTDSCTGLGKAWLSHGFVMFKVHLYYIQPEIISDLVNCWY